MPEGPPIEYDINEGVYCATCYHSTGARVQMEPIADVLPGQKQKCPTCLGTWAIVLREIARKAE